MRQRSSGISATARSQQQPSQNLTFKPKSEWKHENEFSVLYLYLHGFTMDQITITPDYSKRTMNVEGKRRLPNNRLLPVNETFNVPEDCEFPKLDKQFEKGILMLRFPKKVPQSTKLTNGHEEPVGDGDVTTAMTVKNDQEQTRINEIEASNDEKRVMEAAKSDEGKCVQNKEDHIDDGKGKPSDESNIENLKEDESKEKRNKSSYMVRKKGKGKNMKRGGESGAAKALSRKDRAKEVMNGDLKLIANMGAAVLVIMGLGVSLFYIIARKLIG